MDSDRDRRDTARPRLEPIREPGVEQPASRGQHPGVRGIAHERVAEPPAIGLGRQDQRRIHQPAQGTGRDGPAEEVPDEGRRELDADHGGHAEDRPCLLVETIDAGAEDRAQGERQPQDPIVGQGHAPVAMAESFLLDKKRVLPCAALLNGEYGVKDLYVGVPVVIGAGGIERIVQIDMNAEEKAAFDKSCAAVSELVEAAKKLIG